MSRVSRDALLLALGVLAFLVGLTRPWSDARGTRRPHGAALLLAGGGVALAAAGMLRLRSDGPGPR